MTEPSGLNAIRVKVTQGETQYLLIESNCQLCDKPTATDIGTTELLKAFEVTFWCDDCDHEWGIRGQFGFDRVD